MGELLLLPADRLDQRGVEGGDFWAIAAEQRLAPLLFTAARTGAGMAAVVRWAYGQGSRELYEAISQLTGSARDEDEAIHLANHSPFGLGSGVLTRDLARGERIAAERLNAGMSFVNQNVRSDPRLPFGGVKHSGYGREVASFGLHEFVNIKSVLVHGD